MLQYISTICVILGGLVRNADFRVEGDRSLKTSYIGIESGIYVANEFLTNFLIEFELNLNLILFKIN